MTIGAEGEAADVREERDAARRCRGQAGVRVDELVEEPAAEVDPGGDLDEEDEHERPDARGRVEDEEGAEHGGDRAAGAEIRNASGCRRAEEQGDRCLRHRRDEAAGDVEAEVAEVPERVLDVLAEDGEEEHVAEDVAPAPVHEHRGEPADRPRLRPAAGVVDGAGVERGVVDGRRSGAAARRGARPRSWPRSARR